MRYPEDGQWLSDERYGDGYGARFGEPLRYAEYDDDEAYAQQPPPYDYDGGQYAQQPSQYDYDNTYAQQPNDYDGGQYAPPRPYDYDGEFAPYDYGQPYAYDAPSLYAQAYGGAEAAYDAPDGAAGDDTDDMDAEPDGGWYEYEQPKPKNRKAKRMLIAGLALMLGGVAAVVFPIAQKAYLAYIMEFDANEFLRGLGNRTNFQLIDENNLPVAEVLGLPGELADDAYTEDEDAGDYYNPDGTVRADAGAASTRNKPAPYAILEIPKINLKIGLYPSEKFKQIYTHMRYGAGIYPDAAMPGTVGNCSVAAHRTGPSDFFRRLNELKEGDPMIVHAADASYKYVVEWQEIIDPSDTSVIKPTDYAALTLTTCEAYRGVSNARRLIIRGRLREVAEGDDTPAASKPKATSTARPKGAGNS